MSRLSTAWACALFLASCSSSDKCEPRVVTTEESCQTSDDCVSAGYRGLTCVNNLCGKSCVFDDECEALGVLSDEDRVDCKDLAAMPQPSFICEAQVCVSGCPDVACGAGETCNAGRCVVYIESFEKRAGSNVVSLASIGWDGIDYEIPNNRSRVVFAGVDGCSRGEDRCAGPAADGENFVAMERVPTPQNSTPEVTSTCRSCACCTECLLAPPAMAPDPLACGRAEPPEFLTCPNSMPAVCASVCSACDACVAPIPGARTLGEGLLACEMTAALKQCTACRDEPCGDDGDCACNTCRKVDDCDPASSECIQLNTDCNLQGNDGCFNTPIARPRSQLTDEEQSLVSPSINLSTISGPLVLEVSYVPFDLGDQYVRVIQGTMRETWPVEKQEVAIQLCASACENPGSWVDANLVSTMSASLPISTSERRNGLRLGAQSVIDWRAGRVMVEVPESARTSTFRVRFLPRLANGIQFGIDNIIVRRFTP